MTRRVHLSILFVILPFTLTLGGCTRAPSPEDFDKEKRHLINVVGLAAQYYTATKKRPKSIEEVRDWAVKEGKATEEDFNSTRDKQPYGIAAGAGGATVFEQGGKNGRCYLYQAGAFREVPQAQVADMGKANAKAMAGNRGGPAIRQTNNK